MKCIRCNKEFDDELATFNAEIYGSNTLACPHCGQPYSYKRVIKVSVSPISYTTKVEDDWGNKIVSRDEYFQSVESKKEFKLTSSSDLLK